MDISEILRAAGLNDDPQRYAGTPADGRDIDRGQLEAVYHGIYENFGTDAARAYVRFVADIPCLSARDFASGLKAAGIAQAKGTG